MFVWVVIWQYSKNKPSLVFTISPNSDGTSELYVEDQSGVHSIQAGIHTYFAHKTSKLTYPLPIESVDFVRFDPINQTSDTTFNLLIQKIEIKSGLFVRSISIPVEKLTVIQRVDRHLSTEGLSLSIPENTLDPQMSLQLSETLKQELRQNQKASHWDLLFCITSAIAIALLLYRYTSPKS